MTFRLIFDRRNLALFLDAEIRLAGEAMAEPASGLDDEALRRQAGEGLAEARIQRAAGVSSIVMVRARTGEGHISEGAQVSLWLAMGINPDIRRDARELQKFESAGRKAVAHGEIAA